MKKKSMFVLLGLIFALSGISVCAEEALTEAESETEALSEESAEDTESWMDYQLTIDGEVYTFPMMYEDFISYGWTLDDTEDTLDPYTYSFYYFTDGDMKCSVYILNLGINTVSIEDCIVAGISIDNYYWEDTDCTVELPCGIVKGVSTLDDITAAYGTPTDTYEGDLYTEYTYQEDYNEEVELTIYKESGVLDEITVRNFVEPDGYDVGEVSDQEPESVMAYVKPDSLSDDLTAYEIELDGAVYTLPVPVSALLEDGWEIVEDDSDPMVEAHYYGWIYLRKDNQTFSTTVTNEEDYATLPEYCWIEELTVGGYTLDMDGALPGGVRIGMTEEEFLAILEEAGMEYEVRDSSSFRYYTYNAPSYGSGCEVEIYIDDDSYFEKDTIFEITCENSFD
ncbi:MAG: hypothetical protein LUG56_00385 [Lachnospiraceae bacterium]|nr:hypothetical protein [Lachnospiraceae bacterium]